MKNREASVENNHGTEVMNSQGSSWVNCERRKITVTPLPSVHAT